MIGELDLGCAKSKFFEMVHLTSQTQLNDDVILQLRNNQLCWAYARSDEKEMDRKYFG